MLLRKLITSVLLLVLSGLASDGKLLGDGSAENPWQIADYEDLKVVGTDVYPLTGFYILTGDIDASASVNENCEEEGCKGFIPLAMGSSFSGSLDGQGHSINHLYIWEPSKDYVGFISRLVGTLTNLKFDDLSVTGSFKYSDHVGGVVGAVTENGKVSNVHVTNGFVYGYRYVGGVAGLVSTTDEYTVDYSLEDVSYQGRAVGKRDVGGIAGYVRANVKKAVSDVSVYVKVENAGGIAGDMIAYSDGSCSVVESQSRVVFHSLDWGIDNVGGIAGRADNCDLYLNKANVDFNVVNPFSQYPIESSVGGLVGYSDNGRIYFSRAQGSVFGRATVGGLVGNNEGSLAYSYFMGNVNGGKVVGGLVGMNNKSVNNCYAVAAIYGNKDVGNLVGDGSEPKNSFWNKDVSNLTVGDYGLSTEGMIQSAADIGKELDSESWSFEIVPVAMPTAGGKRPESPEVKVAVGGDHELFGQWLDWAVFNKARDSIYFAYRVGYVSGIDTIWGTSSYMAVPNKIEISSFEELGKIGRDAAYPLAARYELTADIDGADILFTPIGDTLDPFTGIFNGNGHAISNLKINEPRRNYTGLFGVTSYGTIENLKLHNADVNGSVAVGALVGNSKDAIIRNVKSVDGNVVGVDSVGGLVGVLGWIDEDAGFMNQVSATGKVTGRNCVGGLAGTNTFVDVQNSYAIGLVKGVSDVGGLVGFNYGNAQWANVQTSYFAGAVEGKNTQGVVGFEGDSRDTLCYFNKDLVRNDDDASGLTTNEMVQQASFKGFDFDNVWEIQEGVSYPYFKDMDAVMPGAMGESVRPEKTMNLAEPVPENKTLVVLRKGVKANVMFEIPREGEVSFAVVDVQGREILRKNMGRLSVGPHVKMMSLEDAAQGRFVAVLSLDGETIESVTLK
ncbi:hypothetical protein [Fibrobacter sp. UWEL]|uniref:hypothetical protein n=1 Tax=Fibrobacter sp. UWEL TaxID=1896209 RepID=UPI00091F2502|nr:hypothetical protein [Fibrobacter sp. UWEL]SHL05129.1 hypothetical protein SAMN05720468_11245 [Fibrobacter sp. UWEL]